VILAASDARLVNNLFISLNGMKCKKQEGALEGINQFQRQVGDVRLVVDFFDHDDLVSTYYAYGSSVVWQRDGMYCFFTRNMLRDVTKLLDESIGTLGLK
jgi:hypothetical protein